MTEIKATTCLVLHRSPVPSRRLTMPAETLLVVAAIVAVFGFFAAVLTFSDMTWDRQRRRN